MFDSLYLQDAPYFDSLILSNIFLCNFLLVFWLATLAFMGPFRFPISTRQVEQICFCIFKSSVLVFCRNSLCFCLANFDCDAYLAVDHSLVYNSYPKIFPLLFSQSWAWLKTIFLDLYLGFFVYCSWMLQVLELEFCHNFPQVELLFFHFWFKMNARPHQRDTTICFCPWLQTDVYIVFCNVFFYCFYLWPYILNLAKFVVVKALIFSV